MTRKNISKVAKIVLALVLPVIAGAWCAHHEYATSILYRDGLNGMMEWVGMAFTFIYPFLAVLVWEIGLVLARQIGETWIW